MLAGMASRLVFDLPDLLAFSTPLNGVRACDGQVGIGLERDGEIVAAVIYEGMNAFNCWVHVAVKDGGRSLTREALRAAFAYPFIVCGLQQVWGYVDASNHKARRFDEHLGFRLVATLPGAAKDGGDVLIYRMHRKDCRYVSLPPV